MIALYSDHATHKQFHSEFKSDMDLERLPSGKFDTNYWMCQLAAMAMNLLRLMGKAARMISHTGQLVLGLGRNDGAFGVFARHYGQLRDA